MAEPEDDHSNPFADSDEDQEFVVDYTVMSDSKNDHLNPFEENETVKKNSESDEVENADTIEEEIEEDEDIDYESDTSTVKYEQESFDTFQTRVIQLCRDLERDRKFPNEGSEKLHLVVERMQGGGFNRVIRLKWLLDGSSVYDFILRIPRFDESNTRHDVGVLSLLWKEWNYGLGTTVVPRPLVWDFDSHNAIESPYMIQTAMPGSDLLHQYQAMSHKRKCKLAKELGQAFRAMHATRSEVAGKPCFSSEDADTTMVDPFHKQKDEKTSMHRKKRSVYTASRFFEDNFKLQRKLAEALGANSWLRVKWYNNLLSVAKEMSDLGLLGQTYNCLAHLDLEPRNILVQTLEESQFRVIGGILDWDSAVLAPPFISCKPPMWLWAWGDDEDEDERLANVVPTTAENRELKRIFEHEAGSVYRRFAYGEQWRLARSLMHYAVHGMYSTTDIADMEELLKDWAKCRTEVLRKRRIFRNILLVCLVPISAIGLVIYSLYGTQC